MISYDYGPSISHKQASNIVFRHLVKSDCSHSVFGLRIMLCLFSFVTPCGCYLTVTFKKLFYRYLSMFLFL
jgi:hypothetical protein